MVDYVLSIPHDEEIRFLEPAIGTGVFYSALLDAVKPTKAVGFEIDDHYFKPAKELWNDCNLDLRYGDFFDFQPKAEYNVILANPPYSRHHHIANCMKKRLQALINLSFSYSCT